MIANPVGKQAQFELSVLFQVEKLGQLDFQTLDTGICRTPVFGRQAVAAVMCNVRQINVVVESGLVIVGAEFAAVPFELVAEFPCSGSFRT